MFGEKCKICKSRFSTDHMLDDVCVFCKHNTNEFYIDGLLLTRKKAIERCEEFESLIREEVKNYGRFQ